MAQQQSLLTVRNHTDQRADYFRGGTALRRVLMEAPYLARCSNNKTAANVRPREYAIQFPYMQINRRDMVPWLIFDIDHPNLTIWQDAGLPEPNLIVRNPNGPGAHFFYAIEPVCRSDRARWKPRVYLQAVYVAMAARLCADPDYCNGLIAKTPGHPDWVTTELHTAVYKLGDLAKFVELPRTHKRGTRVARNHDPASRACQLFEHLRHFGYSITAQMKASGSFEHLRSALEVHALEIMSVVVSAAGSAKGALPWSEVKATARSIANYCWHKYAPRGDEVARGAMAMDESLPLVERQRLAAERTHRLRRAATADKLRDVCRALLDKGEALTLAAVARAAQLTRRTVAAYRHVLDELIAPAAEEPLYRAIGTIQVRRADGSFRTGVHYAVHQVPAPRGSEIFKPDPLGVFDVKGPDLPEPAS